MGGMGPTAPLEGLGHEMGPERGAILPQNPGFDAEDQALSEGPVGLYVNRDAGLRGCQKGGEGLPVQSLRGGVAQDLGGLGIGANDPAVDAEGDADLDVV